jgi:enolase
LKKALTYKNVIDMFNDGNKPIGILIDEIDTICKMSDKGGFSEFLNILKMNDKYEAIKQNNLQDKVYLSMDIAASSFFMNGIYKINGKETSKEELLNSINIYLAPKGSCIVPYLGCLFQSFHLLFPVCLVSRLI